MKLGTLSPGLISLVGMLVATKLSKKGKVIQDAEIFLGFSELNQKYYKTTKECKIEGVRWVSNFKAVCQPCILAMEGK